MVYRRRRKYKQEWGLLFHRRCRRRNASYFSRYSTAYPATDGRNVIVTQLVQFALTTVVLMSCFKPKEHKNLIFNLNSKKLLCLWKCLRKFW